MGLFDSLASSTAVPTAPASGGLFGNIKIGSSQTPSTSPTPSTGLFSAIKPVPKAVVTPSPSYFSTTTKSGASFGPSPTLDPSGKPLLDYRKPGDTSTTTDETRVDTMFDPTIQAPHPQSDIATPRVVSPQLKADIKAKVGAPASDVIDHAMALTVAGSNMPKNLRPEPNDLNSAQGTFEGNLDEQVKSGKISLFDAQKLEAANKGLPEPFTDAQPQGFWNTVTNYLKDAVNNTKAFLGQTAHADTNDTPPPTQPKPTPAQLANKSALNFSVVPNGKALPGVSQETSNTTPKTTDEGSPDIKTPFAQSSFKTGLTGPGGAIVKAGVELPERITQEIADILNQTFNGGIKDNAVFQAGNQKVSDSFSEANDLTKQMIQEGNSPAYANAVGTMYGVSGLILDLTPVVSGGAKLTLAATQYNAPLEEALARFGISKGGSIDTEDLAKSMKTAASNLQKTQDPTAVRQFINDYKIITNNLKADTPRASGLLKFMQTIAARIEAPLGGKTVFDLSRAGEESLPGYRARPGQAPAFGMSTEEVQPVGFGDQKPMYHGANAETAASIKVNGFQPSKEFPGNGMVSTTESPDIAKNYAGDGGETLPVSSTAKNVKTYATMDEYENAMEKAPGTTAAEKENALNADVDQVRITDGDGKGNSLILTKPDMLKLGAGASKPALPTEFKGYQDLSTNVLNKLEGKTLVAKQFIADLTNSPDLKQQERDKVREVLNQYPDGSKVPVKEFADKVKAELLPLTINAPKDNFGRAAGGGRNMTDTAGLGYKYEHVSLPKESRGPIENYKEHVYESPIQVSAGDSHFEQGQHPGYFGHTRIEDVPGNTRRVIEVQSDLYQKGNLEKENARPLYDESSVLYSPDQKHGQLGFKTVDLKERNAEVAKLKQYSNPTAHFRMAREEIKQAAIDGKTKLQFPTGETAMKIEGLGGVNSNWNLEEDNGRPLGEQRYDKLTPENIKVGLEIRQGFGDPWTVTSVLGDGKFEAVPSEKQSTMGTYKTQFKDLTGKAKEDYIAQLHETFDISGKVDTSNPIYKFYEKDLGKYLKNNFGAKPVTDAQGITWNEVPVSKEIATKPVTAFKRGLGGKIKLSAADLKKAVFEDISPREINLNFRRDLIGGNAIGRYTTSYTDVIGSQTKPMIELYLNHGQGALDTAYHEAGHHIFSQLSPELQKEGLDIARKEITPLERAKYFINGYPAREHLEEYIADQYAKAKQAEWKTKNNYRGPWKKIFDAINTLLKKIINQAKKIINNINKFVEERGGYQSGKADFFANLNDDAKPLDEHLNNLKVQLETLEAVVENNPARELAKYANASGELNEVLGTPRKTGGKFTAIGDQIAQEHGFVDSESARIEYANYRVQKKRVSNLKKDIANLKKVIAGNKLEDKDAKSLKFLLDKNAELNEKEVRKIASKTKPTEIQKKLDARRKLGEEHFNQILEAVRSTQSTVQAQTLSSIGQISKEAYNIPLEEFERIGEGDPLNKIVIDTSTPVKEKVGLLDYLRTPDRVLEKLGLHEVSAAIRASYENYLTELPLHLELIHDWKSRVPTAASSKAIFRWLDGQEARDYHAGKTFVPLTPKELTVAKEMKAYFEEWAERLGLPDDNRISHYITHIFSIDEIEKEFDEDLAAIIRNKVPGSVYDPFLEKRLGRKGYLEDAFRATEAYAKRAVRKANMDPALEKLKSAAAHYKTEDSQFNYLKHLGDRINLRPTEIDNLLDNTIKQIVGYRFGQRPTAVLSREARQWVARSMLGLNIGSAVKNLTQGVNTFSKLGVRYTAIGYMQLLTKANSAELEESGILKQDIIQDKIQSATRNILQKFDKALFAMFEIAEKVNRGSAYFGAKAQGISKGMTEDQAIEYAKKVVRDTQFQFGSIDTPVGLNSDIAKTFTQFMTFGIKNTEFVAEMAKNKEWGGLLRYILASALLVAAVGKAFNLKWTDFVPGYSIVSRFGLPPTLSLPLAIMKAVFNAPDQYGNVPSTTKKLENVATALPIPASLQATKTYKGIQTVKDPSNKIPQTPLEYIRGAAFGGASVTPPKTPDPFASAAKSISTQKKADIARIQPIYNRVQQLMTDGRTSEAEAITAAMTPDDYSIYKTIKSMNKALETKNAETAMVSTVMQVQSLLKEGNTADAEKITAAMTPANYKIYAATKKRLGIK